VSAPTERARARGRRQGIPAALTAGRCDATKGAAVVANGVEPVHGGRPRQDGELTALAVAWNVALDGRLQRSHPATVVIADRQPMYREVVAQAIRSRPALELVGEAADSHAAVGMLRELQPEIVLLDVRLPEAGGFEVLNVAIGEGLRTRLLFLTADETQLTVYQSLVSGAAGFLSKNDDETEICTALEVVACGGALISPRVHGPLLDELHLRGGAPLLGDREREILRLLADGLTTTEIGRQIHLAEKTVKSVLSRTIYKRLGVRGATAAVAEALRRGWIQ
jgi:two-component system, NarL family, nitrate/nitrite response regulator NarL